VDFVRQRDGSYLGSVTPDLAHAVGAGLWEIHAFGVGAGKDAVPRDAKTAFAVSLPVARFDGSVVRERAAEGLAVRIGIEAAAASRTASPACSTALVRMAYCVRSRSPNRPLG
jgi:hypothetical protein